MDTSLAIEARGLRKTYGDVVALGGVDLEVPAGTVLGLLGPNGAGKTTIVRILTTLLPPDEGTGRVLGLDVVHDAVKLRTTIGLAGQYAAVDENLTGQENLEMVGRLYHLSAADSRSRGVALLDRFALDEAAKRLVRTYSGGMRRRLDLAAALVAQPPVLFLDEPTTGLDPRSRRALWETIQGLVHEGTTVLLTTQYLDEAERLADRIAVIDRGVVIAQGSADDLKSQVGGERLEVVVDDPGQAEAAIAALAGLTEGQPTVDDRRLTVPVRIRTGCIAEAVRRLDGAGVGIDDVAVRRPTLDDVFFALTGHAAEIEGDLSGGESGVIDGSQVQAADTSTEIRGAMGRPVAGPANVAGDIAVLAKRNLLRIRRAPDLLLSFTVQPIMFVLLFVYVFGGAINTPGFKYVNYLMPGIIVQTISFGGFVTALGLADDLKRGLIDRFRSLPMARSALLAGRTLSDVFTNLFSIGVMITVGTIAGFRFSSSPLEVLAGIALVLLFGYACSWIFAFLGLTASSPEAAQSMGFLAIFPLAFASSAFVPVDSMPAAIEAFARVNPFSIVVNAIRALFVGTPAGNNIWGAVVWSLVLIAIFAPLSVARYRRSVTR